MYFLSYKMKHRNNIPCRGLEVIRSQVSTRKAKKTCRVVLLKEEVYTVFSLEAWK